MTKNLTPRYFIITLILFWALSSLLPTWRYQRLSEDQKEEMKINGELENLESKVIRQGLDLKGGMYIVLEADIPALISNLASFKDERLLKIIEKTREKSASPSIDIFTIFKNEVINDDLKLSRYYHEYGASLDDIVSALREESDDAINRVLEILQNRVDQFGVSEPTIQKQGKHRIVVELAGIKDSERARGLLQSTALLEFYLVKNNSVTNELISQLDEILKNDNQTNQKDEITESKSKSIDDNKDDDDNKAKQVSELFTQDESTEADSLFSENAQDIFDDAPFSSLLTPLPGDIGVEQKNIYLLKQLIQSYEVQKKLKNANGQILFSQEAKSITPDSPDKFYRIYYLEKQPELTGGIVEEAKADLGSIGGGSAGQSIVSLSMNNEGSRTWSRVTGANIGERIAIVLDKKVHMAPSIREKIPSGRTQIEGFANINEAKDLAIILRAGALPTPVKIIEERIVGPSLGTDSITKGTQAVIFGLIAVLIFMIIYYKLAGFIANFALIWNILLVLAILASLQATLTLPGIAGLILTVGMSIDANVIIFERIREELRKGKSPKASIDSGYDRAITTIIDANVTTLIASLVLYQFGTGPIKGFATVLFWGILISMFTAVYITRTILNTYISKKTLTKLSI